MSAASSRCGAVFMASLMFYGSTGCAITDANRTRAEGAAAGAVIGTVLGNALSRNRNSVPVGAAIGAIIGFLFGNGVAQEKATYAQQEQYLIQLAKRAEDRAVETAEFNNQLQQEVAALQALNEYIDSQRLDLSERNRLATDQNARANALLFQTNQQIAVVRQDLASLREVIAAAQRDGALRQQELSASLQLVANQTAALEEQHLALARAAAQLQLIDTRRD